jgi:peptidoglycan/LPS O-acetylase OafA/YrhL
MIEEHFYLLFPFIYLAMIRKQMTRSRQATILLLLCGLALIWRCYVVLVIGVPFKTLPRWSFSATDCRFDSILFGCVLAIRNNPYFQDGSKFLHRFKGAFAVGGLLLIALSIVIQEPYYRETLRSTLQSLGLYTIFYYCVASYRDWQVRWLEWRLIRWIGWISYSLYLIHLMLLETAQARYPSHRVLASTDAFALSVLYAWAMRVGVENPLRKYRASFEGKWIREWFRSLRDARSLNILRVSTATASPRRRECLSPRLEIHK